MKQLTLLLALVFATFAFGQREIKDKRLILGNGSASNITIEMAVGMVDVPMLRYNITAEKWEFTHDGLTWETYVGLDYTDTQLALKAPLASPALTGTPTAPTQAPLDNSTKIATTAYVEAAVTAVPDATTLVKGKVQLAGDLAGTADLPTVPGLALKADIASPTLTGTPSAPTPGTGNDSTRIATTEFVNAAIVDAETPDATTSVKGKLQLAGDLAGTSDLPTVPELANKAPLASPALTGTPTVPTQSPGDNSTRIASTAYVAAAVASATPADATVSSKGIVQLAGDLAGTATSPTVPGLATKANDNAVVHISGNETITGTKDFTGKLVATSTTNGSQPCPGMTQTQRDAIPSPAARDCIYNTTTGTLNVHNGTIWKSAGGGLSNWATASVYAVGDIVVESLKIYQALTAHTSGTFATDLASLKWTRLNDEFSAKAQNGSSALIREIQLPNNQLTPTATDKARIETGNKNLLINPSFENLVTPNSGWSSALAGNTVSTAEAAVTTRVDGAKGYQYTCNGIAPDGGTCTFYQDATTTQAVQGVASIYVSTDTPAYGLINPVKVMARKNAVNQTATAVPVVTTSLQPYKVPVVLDTTSTGIAVQVTAAAGQTIIVTMDDASVGAQDIKTPGGTNDTSWAPCTFSTLAWQGLGTVTNTLLCRRDGDDLLISGKITVGTITGSEVQIPMPLWGGVQLIPKSIIPAVNVSVGRVARSTAGASQLKDLTVIASPSVSYLGISTPEFTLTNNPIVRQVGADVSASLDSFSFENIRIPIQGWASGTTAYSQPYYAVDRIGEVIYSTNAVAPSGFISALGSAIGASTSAAAFKGQSYYPLYEQLWSVAGLSTTAGFPYVISSAKGASALADWTANKTITIDYATNALFVRAKAAAATLGSYTDDKMQGHLHGPGAGSSFYWAYNGGAGTRLTGTGTEATGITNTGSPVSDGTNGTPRTGLETAPDHTSLYMYVRYQADNQVAVLNVSGLESCANTYECTDTYSARILANNPTTLVLNTSLPWISCSRSGVGTVLCTYPYFTGANALTSPDGMNCVHRPWGVGAANTYNSSLDLQTNTGFRLTTSNSGAAADNIGVEIICQRAGADFTGKTAKAVASDQNVRSIGAIGVDIQAVYFGGGAGCAAACTSGTCTICTQVGTKITSVTWFALGQYNVNGVDGTKYVCTGQGAQGGSAPYIPLLQDRGGSTSSLTRIVHSNGSTALTDAGYASLTCVGIP